MAVSFIQRVENKKGVSYKAHYTDPATQKRHAKSFPRRKDAQAFLESPNAKAEQQSSEITVAEAADRWLDVCEHHGRKGREPVARSTLRHYKKDAAYIKQAEITADGRGIRFGDILLDKLTKEHCELLRNKMTQDFNWNYAKKFLTSLKGILDQANCDELMSHKPAEYVFIRRSAREPDFNIEEDDSVPSLNEVQDILRALRERTYTPNRQLRRRRRRYKLVFETMAYGGTRPGEALGLPWHEVHFDRGGIRVVQDIEEDGTIGRPKSRAAYRFIPMPDRYMRQLRHWKKLCPPSADNLVFPNWSGKSEFLSNVNRRGWQPLLQEIGLVDDEGHHKYTPKSLRHVRASLEIDNGANPKEIQRLMGHSSIKITYDIYGHLFDDHDDRRTTRANTVADVLADQNKDNRVTHV